MAEEKKLSLSDLGVEDPNNTAQNVSTTKTDDGMEVTTVTATSGAVDGPIKPEEKTRGPILTPNGISNGNSNQTTIPTQGSQPAKYKEIGDVNSFLGRKPKVQKSPIRKTLDNLYDKVDQGVERTKNEMLAPNGRIAEAKRKYIETMYPKLEARAKKNKRIAEHLKKVNDIIDTDPRFDGITELERHGYLLFVVGHSNESGVNNDYFGIDEKQGPSGPRLSSDNMKEIDAIIEEKGWSIDDDEDFLSLGTSERKITEDPVTENTTPMSAPSQYAEKPDISKGKVDDDSVKLDSDQVLIEEAEDDSVEDDIVDENALSEEETKAIQREYKSQLIKELRLDRTDDLEGFTVSTKPISLKNALAPKKINPFSYTWPLPYTGICIEMTPFTGDEIISLNPNNTNFETVRGLNSVFSILYRHIVNQNKAPFETWLRQTSDYDIDALIFAGYAATFKDSNYITYECKNPKCQKIFLQKKDIMDMVVFPNDETKQRFNDILNTETVMSQTYKSTPKRINDNYAIGFVSQSIYSNLFEPASLPNDFAQKYGPIVSLMPTIDKIYRIDNNNKTLEPINFGVVENSLSKTIQRKVKSIYTIFNTFSPDERSIAVGEAQKISTQMDKWKIEYCIPETTCPHCGQAIERQDSNPLNILFTRAQLPIVAAFIEG